MSVTLNPEPNPNHPLHLEAKKRAYEAKITDGCRPVEIDVDTPPPYTLPVVVPVPAGYKVGWKDVAIALLVLVVVFEMLWILSDQGVF